MAKYRAHLPQLDGGLFLTDGGLETTLYFRDGIEIPCFAAFDLLKDEAGTQRLRDYFGLYAGIARSNGVGFVLETVTWRANADWGRKIGYSSDALVAANHEFLLFFLLGCGVVREKIDGTISNVAQELSGALGRDGRRHSGKKGHRRERGHSAA